MDSGKATAGGLPSRDHRLCGPAINGGAPALSLMHWDDFGSVMGLGGGPAINYLTMIQHGVFETFFGYMPETGAVRQAMLVPGAMYRLYPALSHDRNARSY